MNPKHIQFVFARALLVCASVALAAGSVASCTYTLPTSDGSTNSGSGGAGGGGSTGSSGLMCNPGWTNCNEVCVDLTADPLHCGSCDKMCPTGLECIASECKTPPACTAGTSEPCYDGEPSMNGIGLCHEGTRTCLPEGTGYGQCENQVLPATEVCGNADDEDCNGSADKGATCLTNTGLIVRYILDEANSGQDPMMAMDSADNPLPLTINYGPDNNLSYTEEASGRGLHWVAAGSSGTASVPIDGTKVFDALEGRSQATVELVAKFEAITGIGSRIFHVGMGAEGGRFSVQSFSTDRLQFKWNDDILIGNWPLNFANSGRCVLHVVLDTTRVTATNRVRLFVNGTLVTENIALPPSQNDKIAIGSGRTLHLGNRDEFVRSFAGSIYYAALYDRPLSEMMIQNHASYLLFSDDR